MNRTVVIIGLLFACSLHSGELPSLPLWPSLDEIQRQLRDWQQKHPDRMKLETVAHSKLGHPVHAVRITNPQTDPNDKEHVLITTLHTGVERIGATSALSLIKWLLADETLPQQIRSRQQIVIVPLVNPDGYLAGTFANGAGKDSYTNWTPSGPADPDNMPEAVALRKLMDELQPEVHADIHGMDLGFPGYLLSESSGAAWSNLALRPYHHRIMELMNDAALTEGYASSRLEADAEKLYWGPQLSGIPDIKLWYGRPRPYAALYCYNRHHSLVLASEIAWERSAVLRHGRLLQIGNEIWPGERVPGYPTRVVVGTEMHRLVAWGRNAAERRKSRVELWNKQPQIRIGFANPQMEGRILCLVTTTRKAAKDYLSDPSLDVIAQKLARDPRINLEPIRRQIDHYPKFPGQWGTRPNLALEGGDDATETAMPLESGFAIRMRIPFPRARITDLRLNGHPLDRSQPNSHHIGTDRGFTIVEVPILPERSKTEDLFVITCEYDPLEHREQGWKRPPVNAKSNSQ